MIIINLLCFTFINIARGEEVLILNSSFEEVDEKTGELANWIYDAWQQTETANYSIHKGDAKTGDYFVSITHLEDNDSRLIQKVKVEANTSYKLSAWVRATRIPDNHIGANISILEADDIPISICDTDGEWQLLEQTFETDEQQTVITLALRLGFYGNVTKGMVAFDDVSIHRIGTVQPLKHNETVEKNAYEIKGNGMPILIFLSAILFMLMGIMVKKKSLGKRLQK